MCLTLSVRSSSQITNAREEFAWKENREDREDNRQDRDRVFCSVAIFAIWFFVFCWFYRDDEAVLETAAREQLQMKRGKREEN